jgi:hypothetical protein
MSALRLASCNTSVDIVSLLIESGCAVKATNSDGFSALHQLVSCSNISSYDKEGEVERSQRIEAIASLLISAGCDCNLATKKNKYTPLWYAINNSRSNIVRLLMDHGAEINCRFADNDTPLTFAERQLNYNGGFTTDYSRHELSLIVQMLRDAGSSDKRFQSLEEHVKFAESFVVEHDDISRETGRKEFVRKCCASCFHWKYPTAEHLTHKIGARGDVPCNSWKLNDSSLDVVPVEIKEQIASDMFCKNWKEAELAYFLVNGYEPHRIGYYRRHPILSEPEGGEERFAAHLRSLGIAL